MPQLNARDILLFHLGADFDAEPLEAGMAHRAEETLAQALTQQPGEDTLEHLMEICTNDQRPGFASSVLNCLSRLDDRPGTPEWRTGLVKATLQSTDVEIRDAAIGAVESWQEPSLINELREHHETEWWLRDYQKGVIQDLTGETA